MCVRTPNPISLPYSHSTVLMKLGMRTLLLGISLRRLLFGPGPRTPHMITPRQKIDYRNPSISPFNNSNHSPTTGMARPSGRRFPSYQTPKSSRVKVDARLPRPSNHENNPRRLWQILCRRWTPRCMLLLPTSRTSSITPLRTTSNQRRFNPGYRYLFRDILTREPLSVHYVRTRQSFQMSTVNPGSSFYFRIFRSERKVRLNSSHSNIGCDTRAYQRARSRCFLSSDSVDERGRVS